MPIRNITLTGEESKADNSTRKITEEALANPTISTSTPTTANGLVKENEFFFDGSNLFISLKGTTYKISLTAV